MSDLKRARLLTAFTVAALVAVSFSVIMVSEDTSADDTEYVRNFSDLKDALKRGTKMVVVSDNITLKEGIVIGEEQRLIVKERCTLSIPDEAGIGNLGHIVVAGTIENKGGIIQSGDKPYQIQYLKGSLEGPLLLDLPDFSLAQTGEDEFTFSIYTGVNEEVVDITIKTSSAAPGEYRYSTTLSDGKYTVSYDNRDNKYSCATHTAGTFTIVSSTPSEGFDTVSTFEELEEYLRTHSTGLVQVDSSFEVDKPITIQAGMDVDLLKDQTMTITSRGAIYCEGAFCNMGTLVTNGNFYMKQDNRQVAFYNFGTVEGKVGLSYDDIETLYRHAEVYDIRMFPTYDIFHPIVINCTPYDRDGTTFTYTDKETPGPGEYTIVIAENPSSYDYYIHDAGKLILDKYDSIVAPDDPGSNNEGIITIVVIVTLIVSVIVISVVATRKK